jgi:hypothetical protein
MCTFFFICLCTCTDFLPLKNNKQITEMNFSPPWQKKLLRTTNMSFDCYSKSFNIKRFNTHLILYDNLEIYKYILQYNRKYKKNFLYVLKPTIRFHLIIEYRKIRPSVCGCLLVKYRCLSSG